LISLMSCYVLTIDVLFESGATRITGLRFAVEYWYISEAVKSQREIIGLMPL